MSQVLLIGETDRTPQALLDLQGEDIQIVEPPDSSSATGAEMGLECEAWVVLCPGEDGRSDCPLLGKWDPANPPLLLVGSAPDDCPCPRHACRNLVDPEVTASQMRAALKACLDAGGNRRRDRELSHGFHQYLQFLNHELRTPLAAAQTALDLLEREVGFEATDRVERFLALAQRNVRRMTRCLTWTEEYLATRTHLRPPDWQELRVREWLQSAAVEFRQEGFQNIALVPPEVDPVLVCDPELLGLLVRQVGRAMQLQDPERALQVATAMIPDPVASSSEIPTTDHPVYLLLTFEWVDSQSTGAGPPRVVRTGLVSGPGSDEGELARLVDFTVSPQLLEQLGATLRVADSGRGSPSVHLVLPRQPLCVTAS